jgi:pimeloyl-ACP methyl ester carboxylesterase
MHETGHQLARRNSCEEERDMMKQRMLIAGIVGCLLAAVLMRASVPGGVAREAVSITDRGGKPCLGTLWLPANPKAVILIGHGITANQGVMAMAAKTFAVNGYAAVTFDFLGHGRSRERFDWVSNPAQVQAWCGWARTRFRYLPLAYLGHSMGGFAGAEAFAENPEADAFVAMGALPVRMPQCKTLIAAGKYEELFHAASIASALDGSADFVASPLSDHAAEPFDPILLQRILAWLDSALGIRQINHFPWLHWASSVLATILACVFVLIISEAILAFTKRPAKELEKSQNQVHWSLNPYRMVARLLRIKEGAAAPASGNFGFAVLQGGLFALIFALLLSWMLTRDMFTCSLNHPTRWIGWLALSPFMVAAFLVDAWILERVSLPHAFARFAVAAITRSVPLWGMSLALCFAGYGLAFGGMILGIFALISIMLSIVHAMATRGSADYRAGAVASAVIFAWVIAFWFPLIW